MVSHYRTVHIDHDGCQDIKNRISAQVQRGTVSEMHPSSYQILFQLMNQEINSISDLQNEHNLLGAASTGSAVKEQTR